MPIWGEERITWRQILPPALIVLAIACAGYSVHSCVRGEDAQVSKAQQLQLYKLQLGNSDPAMVAAAARGLGDCGDRAAVDFLRPRLQDTDPRVVAAACEALGKLGDQASAEALFQCLESNDPTIASGAAIGLGGLRDKKAVEPLTRLLGSPNVEIRAAAILALGQIGDPGSARAIEALQSNPTAGLSPPPSDGDRARIEDAVRDALTRLSSAKPAPR